jgi:hypothetical protein
MPGINPPVPPPVSTRLPWWAFLPPILLGLATRLYGLSGQILVDDEWHSLNFVLDKSFFEVFTTHGLGANCIPQNVVNWLLLHTVGWSEATLFLPSILASILGLLLFPWLVSRIAGRCEALFFSGLWAIAPCVIFYSRIVRPYAMVIFFGFLALLNLVLWAREGRPRQLLAYALSGFAAIYFHLYAALPLLAPLGALLLLSLFHPKTRTEAPWIAWKPLAAAGALMAALGVVFLAPAHVQNPWWRHALGTSRVSFAGLWEFLSMLAGTHWTVSKLAFAALVVHGLLCWLRREFRTGVLFLSIWAAFFLLLAVATQDGIHAGIQIARYNILLFPLSFLLAAAGLDDLLSRLPAAVSSRVRLPLGLLLIAGLLAGSPLWRTLDLPNHFMHHSAFQDSYEPFDGALSRIRALTPLPRMPRERIPAFYYDIAQDPAVPGLIEYPMYIGDPLNFHYFTQHIHRKPVAIGVVSTAPFRQVSFRNELVFQSTPIDYVFNRAFANELAAQMQFANLVSLDNPAGLAQRHSGWLVVVHRDILWETLRIRDPISLVPPFGLEDRLSARLGPPVHSDAQLVVWRIP